MILGMSLATFTLLHVIISLLGIAAGFVAVFGLIGSKLLPRWTALFLVTTALTSVTGFLFPFKGLTPGYPLGVMSLILLLLAAVALYSKRLAGAWRGTYVICAFLALYFNFFVLIAQSFMKIPALKAIAPTQNSPVFGITQLVALAIFVVLTTRAFKRFPGVPATRDSSSEFSRQGSTTG